MPWSKEVGKEYQKFELFMNKYEKEKRIDREYEMWAKNNENKLTLILYKNLLDECKLSCKKGGDYKNFREKYELIETNRQFNMFIFQNIINKLEKDIENYNKSIIEE